LDQTYVFIDGEYLRRVHRETMQEFFHEDGVLQLSTLMRQASASRAYFYDSIDDAPRPGESEEARSKRLAPLTQFFDYVQSLSGFHVRLGTVTGQGKRKRRQKEVDILLAVDMLTHGFNGNMEQAVLLAGDLDFRPIVETLVRQGVFIQVWYHRSSVARDLPGAADFGHQLRFRQMYEWNTQSFQDSHHLPSEHVQAGTCPGKLVKAGAIANSKIELYEIQRQPPYGTMFSLWIEVDRYSAILASDEDLELLERYVAYQHGPIRWSATRVTP
jgi:uncharacterized LabA/DUF88 family protein